MGHVSDERLSYALDALVLADRLLVERDNVPGPDSGDASSFYHDEYLVDWRTIRAAIADCAVALGREVEFGAPTVAPRV